jgi:hypothetical protein
LFKPSAFPGGPRPAHRSCLFLKTPSRVPSGSRCQTSSPCRRAMDTTIPCTRRAMSALGGPAMASSIRSCSLIAYGPSRIRGAGGPRNSPPWHSRTNLRTFLGDRRRSQSGSRTAALRPRVQTVGFPRTAQPMARCRGACCRVRLAHGKCAEYPKRDGCRPHGASPPRPTPIAPAARPVDLRA